MISSETPKSEHIQNISYKFSACSIQYDVLDEKLICQVLCQEYPDIMWLVKYIGLEGLVTISKPSWPVVLIGTGL